MSSIQVKNLTHIYSPGMPYETKAIDDVSFEIGEGEFAAIIGHTGSGKSTLIQHLNGLLKPTSGSILIDEIDITQPKVSLRDIRRQVGLVFQYPEYQLFEETVKQDVAFGPLNLGLSQEEADMRVREALDLVGLDYNEIAERSPFELSGGQKRRAAIAGVIAMRPKILILDEPTAGLDPKSRADILWMVQTIHEKEQNIIILVSHNMGNVAMLADKVFVMDQSRLVMSGTPQEVFSQGAEMKRLGLGLPPAADFIEALKEKGAPVNTGPLTMDEAVDEILRWVGPKIDQNNTARTIK